MGRLVKRSARRRTNALIRRGVCDSEAFLRGQLAERLAERGVSVPTWAWTNLLAHGSASDMNDDRPGRRANSQSVNNEQWRRARAYLATEVLSLADAYGPLVELQERVLRPLELDLAVNPEAACWEPRQWVARVSSALEAHRALAQRTARFDLHHQR